MGRRQVRCHGDESRFPVVAKFVYDNFHDKVRYIGDVAGGQGLLSRLLNKRYNFHSEVIDPRGWVLKGVPYREQCFTAADAAYYELIIGLHPDQALRPVVEAACHRPTLVVPCCNFWSESRMGLKEMLSDIERWYASHGVWSERITFNFNSPYRTGFLTRPPRGQGHDLTSQ